MTLHDVNHITDHLLDYTLEIRLIEISELQRNTTLLSTVSLVLSLKRTAQAGLVVEQNNMPL